MIKSVYGGYTPSVPNVGNPRCGPIPPFSDQQPFCPNDSECSPDNRVCEDHKFVLFVKTLQGDIITIPYGNWETWDWYIDRIEEELNLSADEFHILFAGAVKTGPKRPTNLQNQATLHLVIKNHMKKVQSEKSEPPSPIDIESEDISEKS